jgi:phospholipid transport system transporter-binding protein
MSLNNLDNIDTLTAANAKAALAQGVAAIQAGKTVFDLASVKTTDSSAVAVLLAWQRAARKAGKSLQYINLPPSLASLAGLYGVDELLTASPANLQHH